MQTLQMGGVSQKDSFLRCSPCESGEHFLMRHNDEFYTHFLNRAQHTAPISNEKCLNQSCSLKAALNLTRIISMVTQVYVSSVIS